MIAEKPILFFSIPPSGGKSMKLLGYIGVCKFEQWMTNTMQSVHDMHAMLVFW